MRNWFIEEKSWLEDEVLDELPGIGRFPILIFQTSCQGRHLRGLVGHCPFQEKKEKRKKKKKNRKKKWKKEGNYEKRQITTYKVLFYPIFQ